MIGYALERGAPVRERPMADNEMTRAIIANRAFIAAMVANRETIPNQRYYAVARTEAAYALPNNGQILPPEFYGQGQ